MLVVNTVFAVPKQIIAFHLYVQIQFTEN